KIISLEPSSATKDPNHIPAPDKLGLILEMGTGRGRQFGGETKDISDDHGYLAIEEPKDITSRFPELVEKLKPCAFKVHIYYGFGTIVKDKLGSEKQFPTVKPLLAQYL
ncbi:MAG: hypothetical protein V1743_03560, partial [Nanoarchaeota archaeon]